jgi:hypothetical protein
MSPEATRLYCAIKNRLEDINSDRCYMASDEAERRANLRPEQLENIQIELIRSGLVYIRRAERQDRYQLVPPDKQVRRDHVTRIASHGKSLGSRGAARSRQESSGWSVSKEPERH